MGSSYYQGSRLRPLSKVVNADETNPQNKRIRPSTLITRCRCFLPRVVANENEVVGTALAPAAHIVDSLSA